MDLHDGGSAARHIIRDRDGKYPALFDTVLADSGIELVHSALREFETFYNAHRPHQGIANARRLAPLASPITDLDQLAQLRIHRRDRLDGLLHEYEHAA